MKKNSLKKLLTLAGIFMLAAMVLVSCKKDDDDDTDNPPVLVEDGIYIKGAGTALTSFNIKGLMKITRNEVTQEDRAQLLELYVAVKAGAEGFSIVKVAGAAQTTYGPGADFAMVVEADRDVEEPKVDFWRGSYAENTTPFTVPADGLYHVIIDTELEIVVVVPVAYWGLIGAATPGGWTDDTQMPPTAFDLNTMTFEVNNVVMTASNWKFRYSGGWKVFVDGDYDLGGGTIGIKVNTNFGGALDALVPGGADLNNDVVGEYTAKMVWKLGEPYTATLTKTGEVVLPTYPEAMFLVGAATAYGWDAPGTTDEALMHKIAGGGPNEGVFWKIAHLQAGEGFKLAAENWADPNLGYAQVDEFDAAGVTVGEDGGNMTISESGMYIIVLDLREDMAKVSIKEAAVYGIGDAFGGWDAGVEANKFAIDNTAKTLTSPPLPADGNIRMYASHSWIPDWWNAEFVVVGTDIEYRNDSANDPTPVAGTAGQVITLHFDDNTGSIN
jgi:hypothetical protein